MVSGSLIVALNGAKSQEYINNSNPNELQSDITPPFKRTDGRLLASFGSELMLLVSGFVWKY